MTFLDNRKVWKISPGKGHFQWKRGFWQSEKVISIGWEEIGNLSQYKTYDEIKAKARQMGDKKPGYITEQLTSFKQIEEGDIAVAYGSYTILDLGIVNGPYFLRIDRFVQPYYDLYGHRKSVAWLKLGPIPIENDDIAHYLSKNNTIFQITDHTVLGFIQKILDRSFQYRVETKVAERLGHNKSIISFDFDEDKITNEMEKISKFVSSNSYEEINICKEFEKFKPQVAPPLIRTKLKIKAQVILTPSAPTELEKEEIDGLEVYVPPGSVRGIADKSNELKAFYEFVAEIINKIVPNLSRAVALISVEDPVRDAYRYQGRIVFNFNRYLKEKSRFFWFFVAARELAYLLHNRFDYKHNNLMRCLLIEAYKRGF